VGRLDVQHTRILSYKSVSFSLRYPVKRLKALEKHSDLGAGFHIAFEDLQSGCGIYWVPTAWVYHSIGFDLYCRLLKESIEHLKKEVELKHEPHPANH